LPRTALRSQVGWLWSHPASDGVRTLVRAAVWMARSTLHRPAVVPFGHGLKFYCPAERRGMARLAYIFREGYEAELGIIDRFVHPGDTVVDVGAHYGSYTIRLAQLVGPTGSVLAIEPASHAADVLSRNLVLNGIRNVQVERAALGETTGDAPLYLLSDPSRNRTVGTTRGSVGVERVGVMRLDDLVDGPVSFVKMDVEGAELFALRGADELLAAYRPVVLFEYQPEAARAMGTDPAEVWQRFKRHGYTMHRLVAGTLALVEAVPEGMVNLFALPL
jgi:FkbM family methyltransferase